MESARSQHHSEAEMVKASDNANPMASPAGPGLVGGPMLGSATTAMVSASGGTILSARWAKLRADPALQRSAALRARLARRERKNRQRILRLQEFHRLRSMVPTIAQIPNVDKVTVIEEAIKYIDHLHEALRNKFTERGLPPSLQGLPIDLETTDMRAVVRLLANNGSSNEEATTATGNNNGSGSTEGGNGGYAPPSGMAAPERSFAPVGRPLALPPPVDCIPHPCERQRNIPSYLLKARLPRKHDHHQQHYHHHHHHNHSHNHSNHQQQQQQQQQQHR